MPKAKRNKKEHMIFWHCNELHSILINKKQNIRNSVGALNSNTVPYTLDRTATFTRFSITFLFYNALVRNIPSVI